MSPLDFVYRVAWSSEDGQWVATVEQEPLLSWLAETPGGALEGLERIVTFYEEDEDPPGIERRFQGSARGGVTAPPPYSPFDRRDPRTRTITAADEAKLSGDPAPLTITVPVVIE